MALMYLVFFPRERIQVNEPTYWFLMQIGMILGFLTSYPVNWWLIKSGVKEAMLAQALPRRQPAGPFVGHLSHPSALSHAPGRPQDDVAGLGR
jgi:hypothetical protein